MAECVAFKHKDGGYTILKKELRSDKHGRKLPLFTVDRRNVSDPGSCTVVEPYKAPKHVMGNWEGRRLFDFARKVQYDQYTRLPTRIINKALFG